MNGEYKIEPYISFKKIYELINIDEKLTLKDTDMYCKMHDKKLIL